ncbi:predicted protein, partial [Phaeodactylum tricornutum CCAP 1055/1]
MSKIRALVVSFHVALLLRNSSAFLGQKVLGRRTSRTLSLPASPDDDLKGGRDLAREFYEQVRKRESYPEADFDELSELPEKKSAPMEPIDQRPPAKEIKEQQNKNVAKPSAPPGSRPNYFKPRKFTGASPSPTDGGSLFSSEQAEPTENSAVFRERQQEFRLAGNFERTFGLQVALVAFLTSIIVVVGLSGGITDGSDRDF